MDFKLEEVDHEFLWRKGYLTTKSWLDKRTEKAKEKRKKIAKSVAHSLIARARSSKSNLVADAPRPKSDVLNDTRPLTVLEQIQKTAASKVLSDSEKLAVINNLAGRSAPAST